MIFVFKVHFGLSAFMFIGQFDSREETGGIWTGCAWIQTRVTQSIVSTQAEALPMYVVTDIWTCRWQIFHIFKLHLLYSDQ